MSFKVWRRGAWVRVLGYGLRVSCRADVPPFSDREAGRCVGRVSWRWLRPEVVK